MFYAAIIFLFITLLLFFLDTRKPKNYPPGPYWYPIIGNALQITQLRKRYKMLCKVIDHIHKIYDKKGVIGLKIGKDKLVVAYTWEAIKEMLTNEDLDGRPKGLFYISRTFGEHIGILLTDKELWQEQRRFIMKHLKEFGFARREMENIIQNEAEYLLNDMKEMILKENGLIKMHNLFGVYVLNSLWKMMAGKRYDRQHKELNELQKTFTELLKTVDMVGCLFSHFPFLSYLTPNYSGYTQFINNHNLIYEFFKREIDNHRQHFCPENEPCDLIDSYLNIIEQPNHKSSFSEKQLLAVCLDLFLAGSETTTKSLGFAFLHMIRDKTIQDKAQDELDRVIGRSRLPKWEDRINLPYIDAIVHESLRFFMGNGFGVPHRAQKKTKLHGFDIQKDTMVIACFTGVLMNENKFPNPNKFYPDRFIKDNKLIIPEYFTPFGIGRHRCMGEILGRQNLFLFIATLLQNFRFDIPKESDLPDSNPIDGATPGVKNYTAFVELR